MKKVILLLLLNPLMLTLPALADDCKLWKPLPLDPFDIESESILLVDPVFDKTPNVDTGRPLTLKLMKVTNRVRNTLHPWLGFRLYANSNQSVGMADVYDAEDFISMSGHTSKEGAITHYQSVYIRRANPINDADSYYFTLKATIQNNSLTALIINVPTTSNWPINKAEGYETLCLKKARLKD